jgi:protease-4
MIMGSSSSENPTLSLLDISVTYGYTIKDILAKVAKEDEIKGILLHISTPGGTIFGSMAIYEGIKAYQATTHKPVFVYIEGLAASGGVMAMVAADKIYADYGSMIGSIGVIGPTLTYYNKPIAIDGGLFSEGIQTTGGIEQTIISAGFGKDLGNPFRRSSQREIDNLQQGLEQEYQKFVEHVAKNRHIKIATIKEQMGAQIFSNTQALKYGLIDGTLNRDKSIEKLAKQAKIVDSYQLVGLKTQLSGVFAQIFGLSKKNKLSSTISSVPFCQYATTPFLVYYGHIGRLCK